MAADIVKSTFFSGKNDIAAIFPAGGKHLVVDAQELIVVIAKRGKPTHFDKLVFGSGTTLAATNTLY